ncbi:MAG TPA: lytic transglycosylase domain-containing protein, partial [Chloroflexota bacterium]|nr:lytic transglycosylase domain-containing protein [Chloroflexota bacterium]
MTFTDTLANRLPDVPETDWNAYQVDQFNQGSQSRIDQLGFDSDAGARIATLAPPPPTPSTPAPTSTTPPPSLPDSAFSAPSPSPSASTAPPPSLPADGVLAPPGATFVQPGTMAPPGATFFGGGSTPPTPPTPPPPTLPDIGAPSAPQAQPTAPGGDLQDYARAAAQRAGIDPDIFVRQIQQESGFNPNAKSPAGATGIAQIVPQFHPGVDPNDPYASLDYAANLDAQHLQRYGGDYSKALAAFNAGAGAVDRYGGIPPFEETQRYVDNILQGKNAQAPITPAESLGRIGGWAQPTADRVSQFGDRELTTDESYAACGPAAAVRFAQAYGRNPTLREAVDLAQTVGWTSAQGMAGIGSEQALLNKMGIPTKLTTDVDAMAREAQTGNPVTISTPGHYFYADSYDPNSGAFHVG